LLLLSAGKGKKFNRFESGGGENIFQKKKGSSPNRVGKKTIKNRKTFNRGHPYSSPMKAKPGSDGRPTLSGWVLNSWDLDFPGFAWRTKNLLLNWKTY